MYSEILHERKKHNKLTPVPLTWLNAAFGKKESTPECEQRAEIAESPRDITGVRK